MVRREMQSLGTGLEKVIAASLKRMPGGDAPRLAWPLACGGGVADRTRAVSYTAGILTVLVADAGWRAELQHLAPSYLAALNRYCGNTVRRIEFVISSSR